jgi:ATP-dependent helicase YprA (DUF1998 family)
MDNNKIIIQNKDEAYVQIECSDGISYELSEHFTFQVPGAQFTPQYRARLWDGKIRLYNRQTRLLYRGLVPYVAKFCEERYYDWEYENEDYDEEFSLVEATEFIKKLNPKHAPRDYQIDAFVHAVRTRRSLLLSPTASGKSLIIYLLSRFLEHRGLKKGLIIVPTVSLVEQLTGDFKDYSETNGWNTEEHIHKIYQGQDKIGFVVKITMENGNVYTFDSNENIKIINSSVGKKAGDITENDEIDDIWLQSHRSKQIL